MGRRARLTKLAADAELGEVRHIHRERARVVGPVGCLGIIVAAVALPLCIAGSPLVALIVAVVAVGGSIALVNGVPVAAGQERRWIAVCRDGLLVDADYAEPVVVRWSAILARRTVQISQTRSLYQVTYVDGAGTPQTLSIGAFSGYWALVRSIGSGTPARLSRVPALAGGVLVVAVLGLFVWQAVLPKYLTHHDALPATVEDLSVACHPPGTAYPDAAAFAGPAPHPVAVYLGDFRITDLDPTSSVQWLPDDPHSVQLVACVTEISKDVGSGPICSYSMTGLAGIGGPAETVIVTEARYRIDVYELRTHRRLASTIVTGADESCPQSKFSGQAIESQLTVQQYHDAMDKFVTG
jgi:hypothetical protein